MGDITLQLREGIPGRVDATGVTPDALAAADPAKVHVRLGRVIVALADVFEIDGTPGSCVRFVGNLEAVDGIGAGLRSGTIVVDGSAGHHVGAAMAGGSIEVHGDVRDHAGTAMTGGVLHVHGSAGHAVGAAYPGERRGMTGGEIVVTSSIGDGAASGMRRGLIAAGGDVAQGAGRGMIAGTLVAIGSLGSDPGIGNKRGTILTTGRMTVPSTYRAACTYAPPVVRLLLLYLRRRFGLVVIDEMISGRYRRHCGDVGNPGKGELLEWMRP